MYFKRFLDNFKFQLPKTNRKKGQIPSYKLDLPL